MASVDAGVDRKLTAMEAQVRGIKEGMERRTAAMETQLMVMEERQNVLTQTGVGNHIHNLHGLPFRRGWHKMVVCASQASLPGCLT